VHQAIHANQYLLTDSTPLSPHACRRAETRAAIAGAADVRLDVMGSRWYWALAALCAGGVSGLLIAIYASFSGQALYYQMGVQAAYICALGVILWRLKDALQQHLAGVLSSTISSVSRLCVQQLVFAEVNGSGVMQTCGSFPTARKSRIGSFALS
jgi:hypothetical protein